MEKDLIARRFGLLLSYSRVSQDLGESFITIDSFLIKSINGNDQIVRLNSDRENVRFRCRRRDRREAISISLALFNTVEPYLDNREVPALNWNCCLCSTVVFSQQRKRY